MCTFKCQMMNFYIVRATVAVSDIFEDISNNALKVLSSEF
jgi:hypothetical protein